MEALKKITKDKNDENVPHLEITEVVLVHCNTVNNDYQQNSRVLDAFFLNKPFGSLSKISAKNHIFLKTFYSEFQTSASVSKRFPKELHSQNEGETGIPKARCICREKDNELLLN